MHEMLDRVKTRFSKNNLLTMSSSLLAVLVAFIIGGFMTIFTGSSPLEAYGALFKGSLGSVSAILQTVRYMIPLVLLAVSFAVGRQGGLFNIGQESQMLTAAVVALWVNTNLSFLPAPILVIVTVLAGMLAGAIMAVIPACLKFYFGVNEAMIFLMLNYIMELIVQYMLLYTALAMPGSAAAPKSISFQTTIPMPVVYGIVILVLVLYAVMMDRSTLGFRIRILGKNPLFAQASGISSTRILLISATIGGALAGLAALCEVMGVYGVIYSNFASGTLTYQGITAGLLGHYTTIGMLFGSLLLGALQAGSVSLSVATKVPSEIVSLIQGLVMFFATVSLITSIAKSKERKERRGHRKGGRKE